MSSIVADTHSVLWFLTDILRLSATALTALRATVHAGDSILVSAITVVEIVYLIEKQRIDPRSLDVIQEALQDPGSAMRVIALDQSIALTLQDIPRATVPDMPDRASPPPPSISVCP